MSGYSQSKPTYSFGQTATSGGSGALFGSMASGAPSSKALFGSSATPSTTSGSGLFGSTRTAPGSSVFGGGGAAAATTQPSSSFGGNTGGNNAFGGASKPAAGGFNFGQAPANKPSGGLFGSGQAASPADQSFSQPPSASTSTGFSGFSTPSKPSDTSAPGQGQTSNLFGGAASTGNTDMFGTQGFKSSSAGQESTITPTSKSTTSLFGNSTTPAGPPPNTSTGAGSGPVFGFAKPQSQSENPFGTQNAKAAPNINSSTSAFSQAYKSPFGQSKPQESTAITSAPQSTSFFSGASSSDSSNLFGNKRAAQPEGSMFNKLNKTQETETSTPALSQQSQGEANKSSNPFASLGGQSSSNTPAIQTTNAPSLVDATSKPAFANLKASEPPSTSGAAVGSPSAGPSGLSFGNLGASSGTSTPSASAPSNSFFSNIGKPQEKPAVTSDDANGSSAPAPASNMFANLGKPATPVTPSQVSGQASTTNATEAIGNANGNLRASAAGPAPPAQSRLKNKSMDDIITRWASDLSKYQKEFQKQAEKVAHWDRILVENSEKIQQLYGDTLKAERATTEVERQLNAVENDQAELEHWLDHYEKEVDSMISNQLGQGDSISGPDQERERTYQLATRLSDRLDEMGRDLGSMIAEINDASSNLSKNSKADDPLSQVVRVLNSHLTQLQQIDQGAAALQLKVKEAQKNGQSMGPPSGLSGPSSDAADAFYRSYMGRR